MENEKTLSSKDICAIVTACGEAGVNTFKFQSLHIEFGSKAKVQASHELESVEFPNSIAVPLATASRPQLFEENTDPDEHLLVEDPAQWELRQLEKEQNG